MAYFSDTHVASPSVWAGVKRGFATFLSSIDLVAVNTKRIHEFEDLNAMSDAKLSEMGLRREDLGRHVFRDLLAD